ncbi:PREDICTED: uncharacterized protein LOC106816031 [Priapulus caudatus]|uniref:Uncharacterized protein LOC106816031 n=1 Tax=Priapulus caudatus TaxID=37621 RepID=A0ABM1EV43_PRICU|nr:PREDICTED: uncharacterized protein LOC106816031 [Priapulus caudatus]
MAISSSKVLAYFDPSKPVTVQTDASKRGVGATLLQGGRPVAYASKSLTETESNYANIEREMLAVVFGLERFHYYIYGRHVMVESDHKPLQSITNKSLSSAPSRLMRMLLRVQRYDFEVTYVPGKNIPIADALSRVPIAGRAIPDMDVIVHEMVNVVQTRLQQIKQMTSEDTVLTTLKEIVMTGWPDLRKNCPKAIHEYWNYRDEISIYDGILVKGDRVIVPKKMQEDVMKKIHAGHQGVEKCRLRARATVFWCGINADIEKMVKECAACQRNQTSQAPEPMIHIEAQRPWQMVGSDLFVWNQAHYLIVVDYYSSFPIVRKLSTITSAGRQHNCKTAAFAYLLALRVKPLHFTCSLLLSREHIAATYPYSAAVFAQRTSAALIDHMLKWLSAEQDLAVYANKTITCYLGKRDFVDHLTHIDPIDGVVLIDPEYLKDRKVYAHVLAAFRYGREDLDVLGLTFRKDLYLASMQVYPPDPAQQKPLTRLQERLIKKLGPNAYPFFFQLPSYAPASVTLQPAPGDTGKPCGVDYELKTYVGESVEEKPHKRNSVRLAIRKVMYAPEDPGPQPNAEVTKDFMMSPGPLHLEASLDKGMYYHGESIAVNVQVTNNSNKTVKKIKITVRQFADICLFYNASYKCNVETQETEDGFPLAACTTMSKVYYVTPLLANNKDKRGLALDGKLKHEDTNLASSTIMNESLQKENLGIIVKYTVKVRLIVAYGSDVSVELPFTLTHPKPPESPPPSRPVSAAMQQPVADGNQPAPVDTNLIQLDTADETHVYADQDDDIIFEDFARLRLKGEMEGDEAEA